MPDCEIFEYDINEFIVQLQKEAYEKGIPYKSVFELTPRCNFNCNMCYVHLKPEQIPAQGRELTTDEWIRIGKEAQEAGVLELTLTGGEPFIRPDFRKLYERFHDMGFLIQIFSNGYLLNSETVEWLKKRPPKAMRFTLYGASDESYEKVCGIKDGFSKVSDAVELIQKAGIMLYLVATVTKENAHDLEQIYRFAWERNLPITHTDNLISPVRGADADTALHQIEKKMPPKEVIREIRERGFGKYPRKPSRDFLSVCRNYRRGSWVTWNGNMQLCAFLTEPAVALQPGCFLKAWNQLMDETDRLCQPEECKSCKYERYCDRCPGVLYAESGENGRISEKICRQAEMNYILYGKPLDK